MTLLMFEGPAGTGKTTRLVGALRDHLAARPLTPEQRVLALTKLHGSRRRMESKLGGAAGVGHRIDCITIDSFAWRLIRRWRGLVRHLGETPAAGDFKAITAAAGTLLRRPHVAAWVGRRYPVVAVDEMQDCKAGELEILSALVPAVHVVCAADSFQDLSATTDCEAVTWARSAGERVPLDLNHRTTVDALLEAARALREGRALGVGRANSEFEVVACPKAPMAGGKLSWRLKFWGGAHVAIISPSRSPFVENMIKWMASKPARGTKPGVTAGPFKLEWESSDDQVCQSIVTALRLPEDGESRLDCATLEELSQTIGAPDLSVWLNRERTLAGRHTVSTADVKQQVARLVQRRRAHGRTQWRRRVVLTVHQAKNREFDSVAVLWPMRLQPDPEQQRRLLYNAITRAKRHVLVLVEDPKGDRLAASPFA